MSLGKNLFGVFSITTMEINLLSFLLEVTVSFICSIFYNMSESVQYSTVILFVLTIKILNHEPFNSHINIFQAI